MTMMPIEATMLAWTVVLALVQLVVSVLLNTRQVPMPVLIGNREDMPVVTGAAGRAQRAHRNLLETLPLFAALVLLVLVTQRTTPGTALAAAVFLGARVAFALVYIAGILWLRTIFWLLALAALIPFLAVLLF